MKIPAIGFFFLLLLGNAALADTHYVDVNSTDPVPPFTSWATAATNIQDAVDETTSGETVMIADGHYLLSSEILVTNNITLQSVNGPASTIVDGQGITRCFNLGNYACILSGLTITNGYISGDGGGIYCSGPIPIATNCVISGNSGGGMYFGTANNCTISGNSGGGMRGGTANDCTISGNSGWGIYEGTVNNCTISGNSGGMYKSTANNCIISGNSDQSGGGMNGGTANNCIISGNSAQYGGGIYQGTANNCTISGNSATYRGGGIYQGTANNCTISGNSSTSGGGMNGGTANNCIVWYNQAPSGPNLFSTTTQHTCSPDTMHGVDGNITNAPLLVSTSYAATNSPCRGAGSSAYSSGTDIDGEAWLDPPSMGCDEYHGSVTGELQIAIQCITNFTTGYQLSITGMIEGALSMHVWDFGDGTLVTNNIYPVHAWTSPGAYALTLTAYNDTYPSGVSATQWVYVVSREATAIHVAPDGNDTGDGASWATAKATIQAGVDAQMYAGGMVWISNGTYAVTSEIVVAKKMLIQSVNGPASTVVDGQGITRCFNLGNYACILSGLTITNGYISGDGGGIYCSGPIPIATNCVISGNSGGGMYFGTANNCTISGNSGGGMLYGVANNCTLSGNSGGGMGAGIANNCTISGNNGPGMYAGSTANNCTISGNSATISGGGMSYGTANNCIISGNNSAQYGGGIYQGTANNCTISGNSADQGGGMLFGTAHNCTISGNTATAGGGMLGGTANNCIVWYNEADAGPNLLGTTASYTCSPDVLHGTDGNITNAPLLVSASHTATNSPCRGAGNIAYSSGTDIDGEAWLNPPSMGCDEYHGSVTGELQITIQCITNSTTGYQISIQGMIEGATSMHVWDFGDGTLVTNNIYPDQHMWSSPGTYALTLTAYNDTYPSGVSVTQWIHVASREASAIHVAPDGNDAGDGASWAAAKATIQAGVDAQLYAGGVVWISNGTYAVTSEIVVAKNILIQSVNGPASTVVDGQGITRCFNLENHACILSGLTITNGYVNGDGGGIFCSGPIPIATNCVISGNNATYNGGGMYQGTANNCIISGNSASWGGGMGEGIANNCIISGNSAPEGGGMNGGTANNCIISGNSATYHGGGMYGGTANNCIISGNSATTYHGGGMYGGTANNCTISVNSASRYGGGMYRGTANNCTISGNSATYGSGGMDRGTANNCIVWYNQAPSGSNLVFTTTQYTCSPEVTHGVDGNITNAPMFMNASNGNFRLQSASPCINTGSNGYVSASTDLDGKPRIIDGTVDMGAYESFCVTNAYTSGSGFALEWMSLPAGWSSVVMYSTNAVTMPFTKLSGSMAYPVNSYTDTVHGAESQCFYKVMISPSGFITSYSSVASGFRLEWDHMPGWNSVIMYSTNLVTMPFTDLTAPMPYPANSYTDTVHGAASQCFYKIEMVP